MGEKSQLTTKVSDTINALKKNGFEVWFAANKAEAEKIFWEEILPQENPKTVSWGDSLTLESLGIIDKIREMDDVELIETFGEKYTWREKIYNRKKALLVDMFLTGSNAVTTKGQLVNLDMVGNRVAGIIFGPRRVVIFVGVNKIVEDMDEAMDRIKSIAAPLNAKRHTDLKTPCQVTGQCSNCTSPQRICNTWVITEKSYPVGRIKVVIINEELGL